MFRLIVFKRFPARLEPLLRLSFPGPRPRCPRGCRRTFASIATSHHPFSSNSPSWPSTAPLRPSAARKTAFRSFSGAASDASPVYPASNDHPDSEECSRAGILDVDKFVDSLEGSSSGWWPLYVRGEVPDYPPRREMFERLTAEGIDVELMEAYEVEDFTRWLLMRKKYGPGYPRMPYDVTLEQKIEELRRRIPLSRSGSGSQV
ncbi:hypothetical protein, conserved [Babesia bigemina]|uniref:Uncharacterized protein n=1 Tax=Babesia bigemina TaxID=5866 RepID=A0A061DA62_BABBI|nr:hypothetical protein, conserved [Babesia bigemina]CDR97423.1 hypothetical protein, conserved [Babesia bigemina]|eukprot:XP_012769609.1 hypothetical protein, conserved [Babesia bigemina]